MRLLAERLPAGPDGSSSAGDKRMCCTLRTAACRVNYSSAREKPAEVYLVS